MKKKYLIITLIALVFFVTGCIKSSSNIKNYLNSGRTIDTNAKDIMPNLNNLPKHESIAYEYTHAKILIFEADSVVLVVKYDDKTYQSEKDKLAERYTFLEEKVKSDYDESKDLIPEYEFSINSYTFKVVAENEKDHTLFPKSFGMIGTSEEKKSIAYLYFCDFELDYIGKENKEHPMANFVNTYFEYDF